MSVYLTFHLMWALALLALLGAIAIGIATHR